MSLRLTLVCHAATRATRTAAFPTDEPLEPAGAAEAATLAGTLGRVDEAWTSPTLRAVQTAAALGLSAATDRALADLDMRDWAGRSLAELHASDAAALSRWMTDPASAPHGGESITDLLRRAASWLDGMKGRDGRLLVVTHAAFIRAAIIHALDARPASFWRIEIEPLSVTTFLGRGSHWVVRSFNSKGRKT